MSNIRCSSNLALSAGAINLFNVKPNRVNADRADASPLWPAIRQSKSIPNIRPYGINGGYYYARVRLNFR